MRAFIATFLNPENQAYYRQLASRVQSRVPGVVRAVPDGSVHLTFAFMPDVEPGPDLLATFRRVAAEHPRIGVTLQPARILWAGRTPRLIEAALATGAADARRLVSALAGELGRVAPGVEIRPAKSAHVTLARFTRSATARDARLVEATLAGQIRRDVLDRVALVESQLTASGPLYAVLAESRLGDPEGS